MKVKELIELLSKEDPELEVITWDCNEGNSQENIGGVEYGFTTKGPRFKTYRDTSIERYLAYHPDNSITDIIDPKIIIIR